MLLNSTQARKIFDKYSFLVGSEDVMSTIKATELFGKEAVTYAIVTHPAEETSVLDDAGNGYEHIYYPTPPLTKNISCRSWARRLSLFT